MVAQDSWYHHSAGELPTYSCLEKDIKTDICVIGHGFTGASAALTLAQMGVNVVCLEREDVLGAGASGLNGGQIHPMLNMSFADCIAQYGVEDALKLWSLTTEASSYLQKRLIEFGNECDFSYGLYHTGYNAKEERYFKRETEAYHHHLSPNFATMLSKNEVKENIFSSAFSCGMSFQQGGQIHPLKYLKEISNHASHAGAEIYFSSPALQVKKIAKGYQIITNKGSVEAEKIILAGNGLMGGLYKKTDQRIVPIRNYIISMDCSKSHIMPMTKPLAVSDTKFVVNYFRMTDEGIFLFGGGERYWREPKDIQTLVSGAMTRLFPQMKDMPISHAWGGGLGITTSRIPYIHIDGKGIYTAMGFSGVGVLLAPYMGHLIAKAAMGKETALPICERFSPKPFLGGQLMHKPLAFMGLFWFSLRDKLGI